MGKLQMMYAQFLLDSDKTRSEIRNAERVVREQSRAECKELMIVKRAAFASLNRSMQISQELSSVCGRDLGHRLALITTFIQGCDVTEDLVLGGQYAKGATVLKQDYELLCRLGEVRNQCAKQGKTPKADKGPHKSQHIYGELNKAAHPSHISILFNNLQSSKVSNSARGISPLPGFRKEVVVNTFYLHVWMVLEFAREATMYLHDAFENKLAVDEATEWFLIAYEEAEKSGYFKSELKTDPRKA